MLTEYSAVNSHSIPRSIPEQLRQPAHLESQRLPNAPHCITTVRNGVLITIPDKAAYIIARKLYCVVCAWQLSYYYRLFRDWLYAVDTMAKLYRFLIVYCALESILSSMIHLC